MLLEEVVVKTPELLVDFLSERAAPFLKETNGKGFLLRSTNIISASANKLKGDRNVFDYAIYKTRKNRIPLNTPLELHKIADKWFSEKFGFKARSQAVLTFGDDTMITKSEYGNFVSAIFPIGNYEYAWSPSVKDMNVLVKNTALNRRLKTDGRYDPEKVKSALEDFGYTSKNLEEAVTSGNEVMLSCNSYVAINLRNTADLDDLVRALNITELHASYWNRNLEYKSFEPIKRPKTKEETPDFIKLMDALKRLKEEATSFRFGFVDEGVITNNVADSKDRVVVQLSYDRDSPTTLKAIKEMVERVAKVERTMSEKIYGTWRFELSFTLSELELTKLKTWLSAR